MIVSSISVDEILQARDRIGTICRWTPLIKSATVSAQLYVWAVCKDKITIEGASACTIAALLFSKRHLPGQNIVAVLAGNSGDGQTVLNITNELKATHSL